MTILPLFGAGNAETWRSRVLQSNLQDMLVLVFNKEIDFGTFVTKTRSEFLKLAVSLMRRWRSPEWFTVDDVQQELIFGAWKYVWKYDVKRAKGKSIGWFVVFNACAHAKTQLHKARGVTISGSPDRKVSRFELPLTSFGDDGEGVALLESILAETPRAEEALIEEKDRRLAVTRALKVCETPRERYAVLAIREAGSLDAAGRLLYDDFEHRIALRLPSEEHADRFVHRQARAVANRLDASVTPV